MFTNLIKLTKQKEQLETTLENNRLNVPNGARTNWYFTFYIENTLEMSHCKPHVVIKLINI